MLAVLVSAVTKVLVYSLLLLLGLWCWYQWYQRDILKVARKLPCTIKPLPVLGHTYIVLQGFQAYSKFMLDLSITAVAKQLYTTCRWIGPIPRVTINKLEDIQKVLTSPCTTEKSHDYDYFKYAGGNGLLTAPGYISKITKRHISTLFHALNVQQLMVVFNNNSRELVADLAEHVDGEPVDMLYPAMSVALKTVCQLIFGRDLAFDTNSKAFKGLLKVVKIIPTIFVRRVAIPLLRIEFIFNWLFRKELKEIDTLWNEFTESPLKEAKHNYMNNNRNGSSEPKTVIDSVEKGDTNLIEVYAEMQKKYPQFTERDLRHEMATLYCLGTDTIAITVSTCLLALGRHCDVQDRVYEEMNAVVGPDDDVTMDHISRMQYLDQVYKETLRWSILVPYVQRRTTEDINLSDCTIPSGNTVVVGLVGPHMDPTIYPNPRKFDPDRFAPENLTSRARTAFIPFSSGSRMCIAKTYSEYLIKTMLIHVLRRYRVSTDMDIYNLKRTFIVALVNTEGYNVKLTDRR